ncbi:Glucuronide carrier protein [Pontiella desulfatans]|uniref:Glucuronide carrier protein n=1 Tax=Pontiella desulfatans TaxID=2750659 RepID=A0A6C2U3R1_PONDE|nr:MFS transporter [Pontiella desulfatans]VGO14515.1 Glucuronide carrier protein [Pontiella desulfatans]
MADQAQPVVAAEDRVPFGTKLAYALGGPVDILAVWILVSIAYPFFNMELHMRPLYVSIILMSLRLWDGIIDPIMGCISDNFRSKWGRRRPFILVGSILAGLTYPLIWWFPMDWSQELIMAWVIGFGILFYSCFTVWAMPYQSLLMEMTPDYNERTRVTEIRGYFQTLAGFVNGWMWWVSLLPIFFLNGEASTVNGMRWLSLVIGAIILVLGIVPAVFVKERYYESVNKHQEKVGVIKSLSETLKNVPFRVLCLFTVFFLLGTAIFDSYGRYVGTYYVLNADWTVAARFAGYGTVVYTVFSLLFIPVFRWLSERIGKPRCLAISVALVLFSAATTWWTFNPAYPYLMLVNTVFIGAGYAGLWLMLSSMQADVVDFDELKTGERREGSFASIFSWILKFAFCIGFLISGPLLEFTGFDASLEGAQPEAVLRNMRIGYIAIPVVALVVALGLLKIFPITPQKAAEIRRQLEARRGKV